MTVTISGTSGVSLCDTNSMPTTAIQASAVTQTKVATPVAGTGPAFSAYQSVSQNISNSTYSKIQFQTKEFDTNSNFDNTTNYRFTPTVAGYYKISSQITYGNATWTSGFANAVIYKNGSAYKSATIGVSNGNYLSVSVSYLMYLNGTTDYIEIYGYLAGAAAAVATLETTATSFQASMVRAA